MDSDSRGGSKWARHGAALAVVLACAWLSSCGGQSNSTSKDGSGGSGGTSGGAGICESRVPDEPWGPIELPLAAYCDHFSCSASLDDAIAEELAGCNGNYFGATLKQGCGFSALGSEGAYGGGWNVFDASGELVGASRYSDTQFGPCDVASYWAGVVFPPCDQAVSCALCMTTLDVTLPVCRFDCDCGGEQPIDPCFGPDSCACYCAMLSGTVGR